ncbi:helix-turn-helix domain-containing protein [Paraconexibacter sp. AEG42_29]|uniref:helix-turn-helix domain-containing protein n=1 Tax=Paraconexibacter sp. AEG42_29 TaxID=2997339 RepID=UPI00339D724E
MSSCQPSPPSEDVIRAILAQLQDDPRACSQLAALLRTAAPARTCHTTASLAAELGTSERTIRRAIASGELVASRRAGRWVMTVDDVRDWIDRGRRSGGTRRQRGPTPAPRRGTMTRALMDRS